jgi:DNA-binding CsgD family transcriptional regulator
MRSGAVTRACESLLTAEADAASSAQVCEEIVRAVHHVARFDWCAVMTTDPETLLPSGGVVEGFSPDACIPFWETELADPDVTKFTDLARSDDPVATLATALDGELASSARYARLYASLGAADELRVAFTADGSCFGVGVFVRAASDGVFSEGEVDAVRSLRPVATAALRRAMGRMLPDAAVRTPVVIVLDAEGRVTDTSAGGRRVLEELRTNIDGEVPGILHLAAGRVRGSGTPTTLTTRLRTHHGRWLRLHVAPLERGDGAVALTIETAPADDVVRVLLDSYGLTPRETEILLRLCRGLAIKEIAADLHISAHTVRDHCKSIYDKAGVSSRGELVARLFSDHVLDRFHAAVAHVDTVPGALSG